MCGLFVRARLCPATLDPLRPIGWSACAGRVGVVFPLVYALLEANCNGRISGTTLDFFDADDAHLGPFAAIEGACGHGWSKSCDGDPPGAQSDSVFAVEAPARTMTRPLATIDFVHDWVDRLEAASRFHRTLVPHACV